MNPSPTRFGLARVLVKQRRAVRPVRGEVNKHYLARLRKRWSAPPVEKMDEMVVSPGRFVRTFANRKGQLFVLVRNSTTDKHARYLRIFRVNPRSFDLVEVAHADISRYKDGISIGTIAKTGMRVVTPELPKHLIRSRGMDYARPIIEECIAMARKEKRKWIELYTLGEARARYYERFGFVRVSNEFNTVQMRLFIN